MATCSKLPLLFVLAAAVCTAGRLPAPYKPIPNLDAPHIQELGEWAVEEHVKQANDGLTFLKVVDGQFQYAMGRLNYKLFIDAWSGADGMEGIHTAQLYEDGMSKRRQLVFFY